MQVGIRDQWDLLVLEGISGRLQLKDCKDFNSYYPHIPAWHKWSITKQDKAHLFALDVCNSATIPH